MSMKRSKPRTSAASKRAAEELTFFGRKIEPPPPEKSWDEQTTGQLDEAFTPYSMKTHFEKGALIQHPKFGRGVVTGVEGAHLEVMFEGGKKTLSHALP
ncbi:MAG: hypothetical protein EXR72_17385 [Myxococcales bacterium]|nr:hypothetical protein [Myxococcales bacterium]